MKRSIAILLVLAMSISLLLSCSETEPEAVPEMDFDSEKNQTYDDADFIYLVDNDSRVLGYVNDTLFSDLVYQRIDDVEKQLDVNITLENTSQGKIGIIQSETFAGVSHYAALMDNSNALSSGTRGGLLYDLCLLSSLNALDNEKWGTPENRKTLYWDGTVYGLFPAKYPLHMMNGIEGLMVVNEQMIKRLNQKDPREYIEEGVWTWDKFEELMPYYAHTDDMGKYVYALYMTIHWIFRTIQTTNGGHVTYKDGDEWQLGLRTQQQVDALSRGYDWAFGDYSPYVYIEPGNAWTNVLPKFLDGMSVIALLPSNDIYGKEDSIAYKMEDFGILTFPTGPEGSLSSPGTTITDCRFITAIPALFSEPEMAGAVINALYEPLEGFETFDDTLSYMRQYYFYDDRDVECYRRGYENVMYDYRNEGLNDVVININDSKTMVQWLEQFEPADEVNRQKFVVNIESSIDELYGDQK